MLKKRKLTLAFYLSLSFPFALSAQEEVKMELPSSPAFSILDFEPSSVMKPTSNKELGADLLNSFDQNGKLLMNIGMEVSPYWLKSHPQLTRDQYFDPTVTQCFMQSFNISAATVKDTATGNNKLGIGFRFKLLNGHATDEAKEAEKQLMARFPLTNIVAGCIAFVSIGQITTKTAAITKMTDELKGKGLQPDVIAIFQKQCESIAATYSDTPADIRTFLEKVNDTLGDENAKLASKVVEFSRNREGFVLELAGASSFLTTKNKQPLERSGIWVNASNYWSPSDAWTFTARYLMASADSAVTNTDIGISYLKEVSGFNFSLEATFRWYRAEVMDMNINNQIITRLEKGNTYRIAAQGSYKIASNMSVNISLGKDFDSPFVTGTSFFTLFGINYSLYKPQKVDLAKTKEK